MMEYHLLKKIVAELKPLLAPARISKIHQPEAELFVLRLRSGHDNLRLLISVKSGDHRLHLTTREWLNPHQPPRFCQLLRARVSRINHIALVNDDRVVQLECSGPKGVCSLMIEMTGATGNLLLLDQQGVIIDVLKRDAGQNSQRPLQAGTIYRYPQKKQIDHAASEPMPGLPEEFSTWSEYLEQQSVAAKAGETQQGLQQRLRQVIMRQQKKLNRRLTKIHQELSRQQDAQQDKIKGDLLLANLYQLNRGQTHVCLPNMFSTTGENIDIELDSTLSPQHNAQKYFKKYKKSIRGIEHSRRRLEETCLELQWLAELLYQLEDMAEPTDLETINSELDEAGLLKNAGHRHKKRTRVVSEPHELISPSGITILRGRNNRHNDLLSGRQLKSGDLWFHAGNCPGAHVLLKTSAVSVAPTEKDINYAAAIAAGYSKARFDTKVEVMMATAENVSRPKGARPGLVTVKKYKTLIVEPFRPE